ncbi:hypothetical protein EJA01_15650 [Rhodovulum iodosum]|nr:hypothetical protein EJA01_15650 [Rhodovulum robiginosum]
MGEFSAGKSTLSNLLIGASPLPVKVTATQLPPVRMSYGTEPAFREDFARARTPLDLDRIAEIEPSETRLIQLYREADILDLCHLIDMPGISDPNMSLDQWQDVLDEADGVIWCTHATQAWRQSEAAVWGSMDPELFDKSLLLVTRFDKLLNEHDQARVMSRVRHETEGLFSDCLPVSLTRAMAGREDEAEWMESGAEAFSERFVDLLNSLSGLAAPASAPRRAAARPDADSDDQRPATGSVQPKRVQPRRVARDGARPVRPERPTQAPAAARIGTAFDTGGSDGF